MGLPIAYLYGFAHTRFIVSRNTQMETAWTWLMALLLLASAVFLVAVAVWFWNQD